MTLIGSFVLMYQVHPTLALLTIFFVPIIAVALAVFNRRMSRINRNIYKGLANYTAGLENVLSGMRVVKAFANESRMSNNSSKTSFKGIARIKLRFIARWGQAVVSTTY